MAGRRAAPAAGPKKTIRRRRRAAAWAVLRLPSAPCGTVAIGREGRADQKAARRLDCAQIAVALTTQELPNGG